MWRVIKLIIRCSSEADFEPVYEIIFNSFPFINGQKVTIFIRLGQKSYLIKIQFFFMHQNLGIVYLFFEERFPKLSSIISTKILSTIFLVVLIV